ncbi:MAG TPA: hypothetical protein VKE69_14840, partial [Planctomycetota bacterium]|nr:hypothetical protein [Planctomycetota bacterium]
FAETMRDRPALARALDASSRDAWLENELRRIPGVPFLPDDPGHYSAAGHRILADVVARDLGR